MPYDTTNLVGMIDISTFCNASCPQCHRTNQANIQEKQYWLKLIQVKLKEFQKRFPIKDLNRYREITFCGTWGDPMMAKDIHEICEYILQNSKTQIRINTNGGMRDEQFWWNFGALSYEYGSRIHVVFDIDGVTEEQHTKYRRNVPLETVLNHMEAFSESLGSRCSVFTVVFKHNENDIENIHKLAKDHGATRACVCPSNRFNNKQTFKFYDGDKLEILEKSDKITKYYETDLL